MRIGIVSDTHNNLKNVRKIVELFNDHAVDRVIHTGDISQAKTLHVFADLNAPLFGVSAITIKSGKLLEKAIEQHGFTFQDPPLHLDWAETIIVVHDPWNSTAIWPIRILPARAYASLPPRTKWRSDDFQSRNVPA